MRAFLLLMSSMIMRVFAENGFCLDYLKCMEILENKQRNCLTMEQNLRLRQSTSCSRKKWEIKLELNGLHMRRAEMARDCVQKSIDQAEEVENLLDPQVKEKCDGLSRKFFFAPGVSRSISSVKDRKKRSASKKKALNNSRKSRATDCRIETKQWHKQCSALAKCCPLTNDCKKSTIGVMDQINEERNRLESLKDQC